MLWTNYSANHLSSTSEATSIIAAPTMRFEYVTEEKPAILGSPDMADPLQIIASLTAELQRRHSLEEVLRLVVDRAAELLGVRQASIRLLDASRTRLLVGCRSGASVHENPLVEFKVGEGLLGMVARDNRPIKVDRVSEDRALRAAQRPEAGDGVVPRRAAVARGQLHRRARGHR